MGENKELLLLTVSGEDRPGITATLMKVISEGGFSIVDIGQSVTHGLLSLSILVDLDKGHSDNLLKDLLFESKKLNLNLDFKAVENHDYSSSRWVGKYVLSCVSEAGITPDFIGKIAAKLAQYNLNILRIDNASPTGFKSLDIRAVAQQPIDWEKIKKELIKISNDFRIDVAFMKDNVFRRNKRLICFDMDSTLIQAEVIDEMADMMGVKDKVSKITERAMNGELNFDQSLRERVKMLKGLHVDQMNTILKRLPLTDGVEEFISTVKSLGYKTAIISGGFTFFAQALRARLGMDYAFANELEIVDNVLTGEVRGNIVNAEQKAVMMELISQQESINLEQVVAVGDGANDLPMLTRAGLGIAFHAKEIVRQKAPNQMGHGPMTSILYFLGIPGPDDYSKVKS